MCPGKIREMEIFDTPETLYRSGDPKELAANKFAEEFLMPEGDVFKYAKHITECAPGRCMPKSVFITRMAQIFNVSRCTMYLRLVYLGFNIKGAFSRYDE